MRFIDVAWRKMFTVTPPDHCLPFALFRLQLDKKSLTTEGEQQKPNGHHKADGTLFIVNTRLT
jgi:hypothetical protein